MYKSFKIIDDHQMYPSQKTFRAEPEKQETVHKDYESIRRIIKNMDKNIKKKK